MLLVESICSQIHQFGKKLLFGKKNELAPDFMGFQMEWKRLDQMFPGLQNTFKYLAQPVPSFARTPFNLELEFFLPSAFNSSLIKFRRAPPLVTGTGVVSFLSFNESLISVLPRSAGAPRGCLGSYP